MARTPSTFLVPPPISKNVRACRAAVGKSGDQLAYFAANMVKVIYEQREIFKALPFTFELQPDDLSIGHGPPKWRSWEDTVDLTKP